MKTLAVVALVVVAGITGFAIRGLTESAERDRRAREGEIEACQQFNFAIKPQEPATGSLPAPNPDRVVATGILLAYDAAHDSPGPVLGELDHLVTYSVTAAWDQDADALAQGTEERINSLAKLVDLCEKYGLPEYVSS